MRELKFFLLMFKNCHCLLTQTELMQVFLGNLKKEASDYKEMNGCFRVFSTSKVQLKPNFSLRHPQISITNMQNPKSITNMKSSPSIFFFFEGNATEFTNNRQQNPHFQSKLSFNMSHETLT